MTTGSRLGHYTITRKLGSGGMGEVYLAHDTRLGRDVALKKLLPELAADDERRTRFEREARAVAALNHPNIVTLYSIERDEDVHFIAMELVDGETLSRLIPPGGLTLARFFEIALPLTDALSVAHEHGVTHRDLKPDNVMVTASGRVKVLDFGLAKLRPRVFDDKETTVALSDARTLRGQVLGTLAYMSPEQAEGREVDHRTDIFSLGVLFHQMLTGRRLFEGNSTAAILVSLLRDPAPPVSDLRPDVPARLVRMIQRCLEKAPSRRYQNAGDLRSDLAEVQQEVISGVAAMPQTRGRSRVVPYAAGAAALAILAIGGWAWLSRDRADGTAPLGEVEFTPLTHTPGEELFPSLSPDGRTIVFASAAQGNFDIYSQRVGGENPLNLTAASPVDDTQPAYSPDGESLAFRSEREGGGIFVAGATGESVRRVADFGYHPAWSPDGTQLAVVTQSVGDPTLRFTAGELWIITVATHERRLLTGSDAMQPSWSPSGKRIAYWGRTGTTGAGNIFTIPVEGGTPVPATTEASTDWNPVWAPDGRHLYFSSDRGGSMNLWRIGIDEATGRPTGRAQPVTTGPGASSQHASISADGRRIAYSARVRSQNVQAIAFDPVKGMTHGETRWITRGSRSLAQPDAERQGRQLAFNSSGQQEDIFVANADGTDLRNLTNDPHIDRAARWSPNGQRIAFYSDRTGAYEIWTVRRDGSERQQLTRSPGAHYPVWSPSGQQMAYSTHSPNAAFLFDPTIPWDRQKPRQLPLIPDPTLSFEVWSWSPDGRKLAGQKHLADLSHGGIAVHELGTDRLEWITDFGEWPIWLQDSRRLLFSHLGKLFLVDSATRKYHEVLSVPQQTLGSVGLSADERTIYYTRVTSEADVWLLTIK
jgi:Tol biopolymer transport system component/predicted Ser/Thr protein kinase